MVVVDDTIRGPGTRTVRTARDDSVMDMANEAVLIHRTLNLGVFEPGRDHRRAA
jgi:hypothetical protein